MDRELIGSWLQISLGNWPPDHYTLLGLTAGESNVVQIEQQVFERMEIVRRYQLTHPEPATEAMNRLAQALICLTDPATKRAYDASLTSEASPDSEPPKPAAAASPPTLSIAEATDPLAWLFGPWNPAANEFGHPPALLHTQMDWQAEPPPPRARLESGPAEEENPTVESESVAEETLFASREEPEPSEPGARQPPISEVSRRGLGTKRALYYRIARTRQLIWAWEQAGKYLNPPRRLKRPSEATEIIRHMHVIRELLQTFPPLLGKAGQPGYLVLSLARQQMIVPMLQSLLPSQRDVLARDWQAGHKLLMEHRNFLRQELRALRQRNRWLQGVRSFTASLFHSPGLLLLLIGLLAFNLAVEVPTTTWVYQVLAVVIALGFRIASWWHSLRPTRIEGPRPPMVVRRRPRPQSVVRRQADL
jgi:hypothetical protein